MSDQTEELVPPRVWAAVVQRLTNEEILLRQVEGAIRDYSRTCLALYYGLSPAQAESVKIECGVSGTRWENNVKYTLRMSAFGNLPAIHSINLLADDIQREIGNKSVRIDRETTGDPIWTLEAKSLDDIVFLINAAVIKPLADMADMEELRDVSPINLDAMRAQITD